MGKEIPMPVFTFSVSVLTLVLCSTFLPWASAFASGRTGGSNQNQIDMFTSDEDFVKEIKHEIGPDLSNINSVGEAMELLESFITLFAEDYAEDLTKKCHLTQVKIDYNGVKDDLIDCLKNTIEIVSAKIIQISTSISLRRTEFERELRAIEQAIVLQQSLTSQQKRFLLKNMFGPFCSTLVPAMAECENPKYTTLVQVDDCKTQSEKDAEEYLRRVVRDMCRNNGTWIFDFLDAKPLQCAADYQKATKSVEFQECERYFDDYKVDKSRPGKSKRLESGEFCNFTGKAGDCMRDLLVSSCKENPKPGQILLNAFKDTRNFWSTKCGACTLAVTWCPILLLFFVTVSMWFKNVNL